MYDEINFYVYILASKRNGTLYIGITNNLTKRVMEHKMKIFKGFSEKYNVDRLVYYESFKYIDDAIKREKNLKAWKRKWKLKLIEEGNKDWKDIFYDMVTEEEIKEWQKYITNLYGIQWKILNK